MKLKLAIILATIGLFASGMTVYAAPGGNTEAYEVIEFDGAGPTNGSSAQLVRNASGVNISIHTNNLPEGAYTFWGIIFNNPDACEDGCDGADLIQNGGDAAVQSSVLRVGGKVVNDGDNANFGGHISKGDISEAIGPVPHLGLLNPLTAEIHFVIRYHGPVVPSEMPGMIHSVGGGCSEATGGGPGAVGFDCFDPQAVIPQ